MQLFHRRRAVHVKRSHQHAFAVALFQTLGQLGGGGGLARALQSDHQDRGRRVVDAQRTGVIRSAQRVDQRVMHDLDDLLAGGDGFGDCLTGGLFLNRLDEIARHGQRNIGLKQGDTHLTQGGFHILFGQRSLFCQPVKDTGEAFGQIFKHLRRSFEQLINSPEIGRDGANANLPRGRNALTGGDPCTMAKGPEALNFRRLVGIYARP